ncbi:proteasome subunit alpha [Candidatus Pacearchaeota archaeon CG10_big_fil_rev_8_21_14_0_10_35_13]|nr:MAG: proteasome subunit alpha [Candidatus Pacearchaeota archaeon CG10_big_fil_rev_8_21_14_0_10_35_13]
MEAIDVQNQVMGYDRAATMFSPDGHLLQVEYAEKAVRWGSASIGMICKDGVVIVSDRRIREELIMAESANKITEIDEHIMSTAAGILSDARVLIEQAQLIAQQNRITYDTEINVESIIKEIANQKQKFTQYGGVRPFGASVMVAGISGKTPKLYVSDITGNYFSYKATAIGENDHKIKDLLREEYKTVKHVDEAIKIALGIFKKILDKEYNEERFDVAFIKTADKKLSRITTEGLKKYE